MQATPFFSIIIPTKDRPYYVEYALKSLLGQTFSDFECVMVNNSECEEPTKNVFINLIGNDQRFRYVRPEKLLPMHENWQFGIAYCRGLYISLLPDKAMLFPNCLALCKNILDKNKLDIINWWSELYNFEDENNSLRGYYKPFWEFRWPETYKADNEIQRRLSFLTSRLRDSRLYFRGKICFGFYHRNLVTKITQHIGSVFARFCPDYTSVAAGLALSDKVYDIGMPLCLSINSQLSHGQACDKDQTTLKTFIKQSDQECTSVNELPFAGVSISLHNLIAYDYINIVDKIRGTQYIKRHFNRNFLQLRVQEDLQLKKIFHPEISSKPLTYTKIVNRICEIAGDNYRAKILRKGLLVLSKLGILSKAYVEERKHREFCLQNHTCSTPLQALELAHNYYHQYSSLPYAGTN